MDLFKPSPVKVDITLGNEDFSLEPFGIPGKVLYTPGHTLGSVSVLLDTGDTFVGDLAMCGFPFHTGAGSCIFAEGPERIRKSWNLLFSQGAKMIYPGHGKPVQADILKRIVL